MKKNLFLIAAISVIFVFGTALVKTENQRYAMSLGMCIDPNLKAADAKCLRTVETRTGWWWHLYYAVTG
jgi:hypothetical protein